MTGGWVEKDSPDSLGFACLQYRFCSAKLVAVERGCRGWEVLAACLFAVEPMTTNPEMVGGRREDLIYLIGLDNYLFLE
jgi:hypothetical protein